MDLGKNRRLKAVHLGDNRWTVEFIDIPDTDFDEGTAVKSKNNEYITAKTLYQMCIASLRYGMSRNNHLEPSGSFENIKEVLRCLGQDSDMAKATARQLLEEIESELVWRDYEKTHNLEDINKFIEWLNLFLENNR